MAVAGSAIAGVGVDSILPTVGDYVDLTLSVELNLSLNVVYSSTFLLGILACAMILPLLLTVKRLPSLSPA